jgi:hypothetical protein
LPLQITEPVSSGKGGKIISHECERAFRYQFFAAGPLYVGRSHIFLLKGIVQRDLTGGIKWYQSIGLQLAVNHLWTPAYTPGDGQTRTSRVYSNNPVLHLYISCNVTVNKLVLSYLAFFHSGDPDQVVPFVLYTAPLYTHTTHQQLHVLVALSSTFVSDTFVQLLRCTLHWLQLNKRFSLSISLKNQQTFFHIHSFF